MDGLADDLARRVGIDRDEMRGAVRDTVTAWRHDAERLGLRRDGVLDGAVAKVGLARREDVDELALRVATLEHRLALLERAADTGGD